jgi:hypothetical protein
MNPWPPEYTAELTITRQQYTFQAIPQKISFSAVQEIPCLFSEPNGLSANMQKTEHNPKKVQSTPPSLPLKLSSLKLCTCLSSLVLLHYSLTL